MDDLFAELDKLDEVKREEFRRAPFKYPGGKFKSLANILPHLPYEEKFIEVFGGSGVIMINRRKSDLDVYNDINSGASTFFRCMANDEKYSKLCRRLKYTVHSREEFIWSRDTWQYDNLDDIEVAARWYYMIMCSFATLGRNFGRSLSKAGSLVGNIQKRLPEFLEIHQRFINVQVENLPWQKCVKDYDSNKTVFYMDPPYIDTDSGTYKDSGIDHEELLNTIFELQGFVAVSGYPNPFYDARDWDERHEWEVFSSINAGVANEDNNRSDVTISRSNAKEVLWIKY